MLSEAQITTDKAVAYMQRLCRHFAHKVPAEFDDQRARVQFAMGVCEMRADRQTLIFQAQAADTAALDQVQQIVGGHLERFAFREQLKVNWSELTQAT
jgi:uncharacterized protein